MHKIQTGEVDGLTLVYGDGMVEWSRLSDIPELKEAAAKIAEEEEAATQLLNAIPDPEVQVFVQESNPLPHHIGHVDISSSKTKRTHLDRDVGKKRFTADDGVKYTWDHDLQDWVIDESISESGDDEDDDGEIFLAQRDENDAEAPSDAPSTGVSPSSFLPLTILPLLSYSYRYS